MPESSLSLLWPDDHADSDQGVTSNSPGPNTELAVILLASGCTHSYVRAQCQFESMRAVHSFAADQEVRQAVAELAGQRAQRIGNRAMIRLERILGEEHTDLRATVLAVRTGLELSGALKRDHAAPVRAVSDLSVSELNQLIAATREELNTRISAPGTLIPAAAVEE